MRGELVRHLNQIVGYRCWEKTRKESWGKKKRGEGVGKKSAPFYHFLSASCGADGERKEITEKGEEGGENRNRTHQCNLNRNAAAEVILHILFRADHTGGREKKDCHRRRGGGGGGKPIRHPVFPDPLPS